MPLDVAFLPLPFTGLLGLDYSKLPHGLHIFTEPLGGVPDDGLEKPWNDIPFDLRGMVLLADGTAQSRGLSGRFPTNVAGIVVGQKARTLHFLHDSTIENPVGGIGRYIVHYEDGSTTEIPLRTNQRPDDPSVPESERDVTILGWRVFLSTHTVKVIWGSTTREPDGGVTPVLHHYAWENPFPEKQIASLDFESYLTGHLPFLLAITAEQ
jgi:hypothetical protein